MYDPFTHQLNENGTYTCGVKGGHCIDITYYDPGPGELREDNTTYCHSRDCATMVKRFRGCVSSDAFIQEVYIDRKGDGNAPNGTQTKRSREEMAKLVALMVTSSSNTKLHNCLKLSGEVRFLFPGASISVSWSVWIATRV